jgi:hypothetical protein
MHLQGRGSVSTRNCKRVGARWAGRQGEHHAGRLLQVCCAATTYTSLTIGCSHLRFLWWAARKTKEEGSDRMAQLQGRPPF